MACGSYDTTLYFLQDGVSWICGGFRFRGADGLGLTKSRFYCG